MDKKRTIAYSIILGGVLFSGVGVLTINHYANVEKQKNAIIQDQPRPKYVKKSATSNEVNDLINDSFNQKAETMVKEVNNNHDAYVLITPDNNSFYKETSSVPTKEDMKTIIKALKATGKPCFAIKNNDMQTVNSNIKNQQEKQQVQTTSPFMLIYFNSGNGKTTSTTLLSSVDTQRSMVVKQTIDWINKTK